MTNKGYQAYLKYLAIQRHFEGTYDYFLYNGKTTASLNAYQKRPDWHSFEKLSRICDDSECIEDFVVANYIMGNKWVKNMRKPEYDKWTSKINSLPYLFKNDMREVLEYGPNKILAFNEGELPPIANWMASNKYNIESFIIMNEIWNFFDDLCIKLKEHTFVWPDIKKKFLKYRPFVLRKINNIEQYKTIMNDTFVEGK